MNKCARTVFSLLLSFLLLGQTLDLRGGRSAAPRPDKVKVLYTRRGALRETEVTLGKKTERSFRITPLAATAPGQKAFLDAWLK